MRFSLDVNRTSHTGTGIWSLRIDAGDCRINLQDIDPEEELIPVLVEALKDTLCFQGNWNGVLFIDALLKHGLIERDEIQEWLDAHSCEGKL